MTTQKNKIPAIYLNDETHYALKRWAELTDTTMPKVAKHFLEEMQPMISKMVESLEELQSGKNQLEVLQNLVATGLTMAAEKLQRDEDSENATDSGKSD